MTEYPLITFNTFPTQKKIHNLHCLSRWGTEIPLREGLVNHRCGFSVREIVQMGRAQNKAFALKVGLQQASTLAYKRDNHNLQGTQSATMKSNSEWELSKTYRCDIMMKQPHLSQLARH